MNLLDLEFSKISTSVEKIIEQANNKHNNNKSPYVSPEQEINILIIFF